MNLLLLPRAMRSRTVVCRLPVSSSCTVSHDRVYEASQAYGCCIYILTQFDMMVISYTSFILFLALSPLRPSTALPFPLFFRVVGSSSPSMDTSESDSPSIKSSFIRLGGITTVVFLFDSILSSLCRTSRRSEGKKAQMVGGVPLTVCYVAVTALSQALSCVTRLPQLVTFPYQRSLFTSLAVAGNDQASPPHAPFIFLGTARPCRQRHIR